MRAMNISETRKHLPRLVSELTATREEVTITKHGKPVAKLVSYTPEEEHPDHPLRGLTFHVQGDFDAPLPDIWEALDNDRT